VIWRSKDDRLWGFGVYVGVYEEGIHPSLGYHILPICFQPNTKSIGSVQRVTPEQR
jgi:hypothetical protein